MTTEFENAIYGQIDYINRMIEQHQKQIERKKIEIKSNEIAIENYSKMKRIFETQLKEIGEQAEKKEEEKKPVKIVKERVTKFKTAHVGKFDANGNQLGLWLSQTVAAKAAFMSQSNLSYIMRTSSKEQQLEKRGYYFAWVY